MSVNDTRILHRLLVEREDAGVHTHEARGRGISGNPSQRAKDLATQGIEVRKRREYHSGRNGSRFWLAKWAPADAVPVRPNLIDADSDGAPPAVADRPGEVRPVRAVAVSADPRAEDLPLAWVRDVDGYWHQEPIKFDARGSWRFPYERRRGEAMAA